MRPPCVFRFGSPHRRPAGFDPVLERDDREPAPFRGRRRERKRGGGGSRHLCKDTLQMSFAQPVRTERELRVATGRQLQALAHPVRMRLLAALRRGPATATRLAEELGESSGSTSYHLRVLGKAGVIEEDVTRRHGRERWWRRPEGALVVPSGSNDPDTRAAEARLRSYFVEEDDAACGSLWRARSRS